MKKILRGITLLAAVVLLGGISEAKAQSSGNLDIDCVLHNNSNGSIDVSLKIHQGPWDHSEYPVVFNENFYGIEPWDVREFSLNLEPGEYTFVMEVRTNSFSHDYKQVLVFDTDGFLLIETNDNNWAWTPYD